MSCARLSCFTCRSASATCIPLGPRARRTLLYAVWHTTQPLSGVLSVPHMMRCGSQGYKNYKPEESHDFRFPTSWTRNRSASHSVCPIAVIPFHLPYYPDIQTIPLSMAVTYALTTVCVRPSRLQRLKSGNKTGSDLRRLTPYPDPKKTFPLSDDHDANDDDSLLVDAHHAERLGCGDPVGFDLGKVAAPVTGDRQSSPDRAKPIEINFTRISKNLRRSPSSPPRPISDRSSPGKRSSLPSLVSSSFDNFNAPPGRPRRNGWIPGEAFVQMNLRDLRR